MVICSLNESLMQDESVIGTDIDEAISYVVSFTGQTILQFTNVTCNSFTKRCSLTVDGSQLSNNEWYIIGVMAINAVSHGSSNFFSNRSMFSSKYYYYSTIAQ